MSETVDEALFQDAQDYFEDADKALAWFRTPLIALGGKTPGEYCTKYVDGSQAVADELNKLRHGMTS